MSIRDPRVARALVTLAGSLALLALGAGPVAAQRTVAPDSLRRLQSVVPLSGPPGTLVKIGSENLPLQARIHVGVGALNAGFETLGEAFQGEWGEISASVRIPESARWDKPLYFIAFNAIFSPIGISEPFHVTDERGRVRRTGTVTDEGASCLTMRDEYDYLYTLTGDVERLRPGDEVTVEGAYAEAGACAEGHVISVTRVVSGPG